MPGHHRLQVEAAERALPLVQVAEPARAGGQRRREAGRCARPGRRARPAPAAVRRAGRAPGPGSPRSRRRRLLELATPDQRPAPRRAGCRSPTTAAPAGVSSSARRIARGRPSDGRVRPSRTSAPSTSASARTPQGGRAIRLNRDPRRAGRGQRPLGVRAKGGAGDGQLGLAPALRAGGAARRSEPTRRAPRGPRRVRPAAISTSARSWLQIATHDRALGQQDRAYGVHVVRGPRPGRPAGGRRTPGCARPWRLGPRCPEPRNSSTPRAKSEAAREPAPRRKVDAAPVDVGLPELQRVGQQGDGDVEGLDRLCGLAGPQQDPRALGVEHTTCLVAEAVVAQGRIAQPQCVLQLAELRSERRLGRVDPCGQIGVVGELSRARQQSSGRWQSSYLHLG